jgi:hypothetical protein
VESAPEGRAFDCDLDIGAYERPLAGPTVWGLSWLNASDLVWLSSPGATSYDVVQGDLSILLSGDGDFSASVLACLENNGADTAAHDADLPDPGEGLYYLVRPQPTGTYDSACASQALPRDGDVQASPLACP